MTFVPEKRDHFAEEPNGTTVDTDGIFNDRNGDLFYSPKAEIIKWAVVGGITLFFLLWFVGGYLHAKRRVRKGMKPLRYHKFLLPYKSRKQFEPQNNFSFYRQDDPSYRMENYGPPPMYNPDHPMPPSYMPPEGSTKADPSQEWIAPPPGAPPGRGPADEESGEQTAAKTSRFARLKSSIAMPSMPSIPSKLNPFSK